MVRSPERLGLGQVSEDVDESEQDVPFADRSAGSVPSVCEEDEDELRTVPHVTNDKQKQDMIEGCI